MKSIVLVLVVCIGIAGSANAECNIKQAVKVQGMMREMAMWKEVGGKIEVKWSGDWDQWTPSERTGMITTFANADACISGKARAIEFYRNGKLVGEASPTFGIKLK